MATTDDAAALREFWRGDRILPHIGYWIAFQRGDVVARDVTLAPLLAQFAEAIREGDAPIFAHVDPRLRV